MGRRLTLLLAILALGPAGATETAVVSLPPASLAKWYPPQSEEADFKQLMQGLGRAMRASGDYHALEERTLLAKWAGRLAPDYRRIGEMVPEWRDELELKWADRLVEAARAGDFSTVGTALHRIGTSCGSCHREFRPAVELLYHIPDYQHATVESSETLEEIPYPKVMERLATTMQRIAIALEDARPDAARSSADKLAGDLDDMAMSCESCHGDKPARERIFTPEVQEAVAGLKNALERGDGGAAGQALGHVSAAVCGECHTIHRPAAAIRHAIAPHEH